VIDVVLDDGGHTPQQQIVTLECLLPAIRPGGVYLCEDINGGFQPFHAFVDGLTHPLSAVGFGSPRPRTPFQAQVASVHRYPLVTVIEKPPADAPEFENIRRGTEWPAARRRNAGGPAAQSHDVNGQPAARDLDAAGGAGP